MRIIVCDDDENMQFLIQQWTEKILAGQSYRFNAYEDGMDLLCEMEQYQGEEPVIIFMDIKLKNDNGIRIAKLLSHGFAKVAVIFISGYTEYFEDSFDADPIYFLIKPLKRVTFEKAFEKALKKILETDRKFILISQGKDKYRIFCDDIYYAESSARKIKIHRLSDSIEYYEKMDVLESQLGEDFVRCHKSFLVNMKYIHSVDGKEITLLDGRKIAISRKKSNETKEIVFRYLARKI